MQGVRVQILSAPPQESVAQPPCRVRPQHAASSPDGAWGSTSARRSPALGRCRPSRWLCIAKYATKATESFGSGLDRRLGPDDLGIWTGCRRMWLSLSAPPRSWVAAPDLDGLRLQA